MSEEIDVTFSKVSDAPRVRIKNVHIELLDEKSDQDDDSIEE